MRFKHLLGATALASSLLIASGASAQTATTSPDQETTNASNPTPDTATAADASATDVVVTGSRIRSPNLTSIVPITSVTAEDLQQTARVSVGDVLNDLPALVSSFSQSNSTRFLGTAGLNLLDLRGLGTQRTLVLVNGRRHVGSDILNNAVSPDVNTFPTDLIDRVDVVTGGNSAVYGSDAIAGVVNFILKDNFQGLQLRGQGSASQEGDAGSYYLSALAGKNFGDGRGNVAVNLEYARQNAFYGSDRAHYRQNDTFVGIDTDAFDTGLVNGSDGIPDSRFFRDVRSATIYSGGLIAFASPTGACGRDTITQGSFVGRPFTCNYIFNTAGQLVPETGTRVGLSTIASNTAASATPGGVFIGGNGNTRREGTLLQILPQLDRYSANLIGHFDFSSAFKPFIEAKYSRTHVIGQGGSGPAFFTGSTLDAFYERPRFDNPYLTDQARGVIQQARTAAGLAPATAATRLVLRRNLTDLGSRTEESTRETYRIVGGFRGDLSEHLNYEVSGNYGEFKEKTKILGNLNIQRFLLGLDAVRNPATGQDVCGSQLDPTRANLGITGGPDRGGNPAVLAADIAACQPVNPFGEGNISDAAKRYVLTDTLVRSGIKQFDALAFLSGDTGGFFNLPGGPVGFAAGGEYRRERVSYVQDPLVSAGYTFYNSIGEFKAPAFEVKEAFGELRLPILKDQIFHSLELSGAGRVSDYKGSAGTVYAYNFGGDFAPIQDIRFRANYARAVRAPNLSDLYFPASQNFAPGFADPCSLNNIRSGSQYREANCRAAGIPNTYNFLYAQSLEFQSGGNLAGGGAGLQSEKSDSYTYGTVIQPRFIPGLSLSVDYFNIKVNNVITTPDAQSLVNTCYDSPTTSNQFCALFTRAGAAGAASGEEPFRIIEGSLLGIPLNYAQLKVRGIDAELSYRRNFGSDISFSTKVVYTHQFENVSFLDPTNATFGNTVVGELGYPKDAANWDIDLSVGKIFGNLQFRYLSKQFVNAAEATNSFEGRTPENADASEPLTYPEIVYVDLRTGINVTKNSNFYFGIDNLTNRLPPLGLTGTGFGSGIFEPIGRRFYAGVTARF